MSFTRKFPWILSLALVPLTASCRTRDAGDTGAPGAQLAMSDEYPGSPYLGEVAKVLYGDIWERPGLSRRHRSMITIAVLQALELEELRWHIDFAFENGLTQDEISEIILHTTFYAGWPTGVSASRVAADVFRQRGLPVGQSAATWQPPSDSVVTYTSGAYAAVPKLGELRNSLLYGDIWERPHLSKRERSMLTVAVSQATYVNELRGNMRLALDEYGVTQEEITEIILHVAFYSGWPGAVNAGGQAAELFEERGLPF